jgi:hypothetical protein
MPQGDLVRDQPMPVFLERPPTRKAQPPTSSSRRQEIGEGRKRIGEEHYAKARGDQIEAGGFETVHLRIGLQQRDVAEAAFGNALAGTGEHRLGYIDPNHPAARADGLGEGYGGGTGAAPDLEHAFGRRNRRAC